MDVYDAADDAMVEGPSDRDLYLWALAEAARAGTSPDALDVIAHGLGVQQHFDQVRP